MPTDLRDPRFESVAPVVLAGGRSRRFGRDKLQEPVGERRLVEHAIAALREVFGPRVAIVGDCDTSVRSAGDVWIPDEHPGIGPMGGVATALRRLDRAVLVLAGDLAGIDAATVRALAEASFAPPTARVALAVTDAPEATRRHPCAAVYAPAMLEVLEAMIGQQRYSLLAAIDRIGAESVVEVRCEPRCLANINEPGDLAGLFGRIAVAERVLDA